MVDIIIPSCKTHSDLQMQVALMRYHHDSECNIIATGLPSSASVNRNYGLLQAAKSDNEFIIMIDDDIGGFFDGWYKILIDVLKDCQDIKLVSARLINKFGGFSPMMGCDYDASKKISVVQKAVLSACIAFRKDEIFNKIWFDNEFIGSGFEDTLFCHNVSNMYPEAMFVVANQCKLIHYHEMKNQGGKYFDFNRKHFLSKCTDEILNRAVKEMAAYNA